MSGQPEQPASSEAHTDSTLESKVLDLMKALKANDRDDWQDRPSNPSDDAFIADLLKQPLPSQRDELAVESASCTSGAPSPAAAPETKGLDALMERYIAQVRRVREFDEKLATETQAEAEAASSATEGESGELNDVDFGALLAQLDALPPLSTKTPAGKS